jgi:hypothetical protein
LSNFLSKKSLKRRCKKFFLKLKLMPKLGKINLRM